MFDLSGKTALVTGASGGIGGAIAKALHGQGAGVVLSGTRAEALDALKGELGERAVTVPCNLSAMPPKPMNWSRKAKRRQAPASTSSSTMPASRGTISSCG